MKVYIKKYLICLSILLFSMSIVSYAANADTTEIKAKLDRKSIVEIGLKAGIDFNSLDRMKPGQVSSAISSFTGFNAGLVFKFILPVRGMYIQPELMYVSKGARFRDPKMDIKVGYLELPVSLQYGFDLIFFRPFLEVTPFVGCALHSDLTNLDAKINRFEYGIGVGGGLDVWRFQVNVNYKWNLGSLFNKINEEDMPQKTALSRANFQGLQLSVAFYF